MAVEACLLLVQSLMGECDTPIPNVESPVAPIEAQKIVDHFDVEATVSEAIAPADPAKAPQFGLLCRHAESQPDQSCETSSLGQNRQVASRPMASSRDTVSTQVELRPSQENQSAASTTSASITTPVTLDVPRPSRSVPMPALHTPQFSAPAEVAALPSRPYGTRIRPQGPASGPQLYRQRQLALQSGRSYTRLLPNEYVEQWSRATRQPTYQEWQRLLVQEARSIAGGQGNNRLEVVVGDSFGLWLPPEMLPRDRLWLNQSISGDTTAGIVQRLSAFANTRPTTIHVLAGANDLKNGVPEGHIVRNLQQIVQRLRQQHPQSRIVVYSVLPTRRADIANERVRSLNARISRLTQQNRVEFRNVHPRFQDEHGNLRAELTTDGLHLNAEGYALWQRAILAGIW
ncbi:GDSL-type esterase/lipase family protein [Oscillatoria sp. CS-180]|uniref:GDSL-type esterase/lipase family protein n=1 Tax=Oscillatoria sp. CS-180 TaxID=3021720 RepID=UPI002330C7BF|nr:GDSL-type esterase/lipase family protein [Oscillatoria sp. CS-180]MDB9529870.1 GDSL-type esterase/lipase family protein [Oscillatoria sp. CS-180]